MVSLSIKNINLHFIIDNTKFKIKFFSIPSPSLIILTKKYLMSLHGNKISIQIQNYPDIGPRRIHSVLLKSKFILLYRIIIRKKDQIELKGIKKKLNEIQYFIDYFE